jgi:hypothetical protein
MQSPQHSEYNEEDAFCLALSYVEDPTDIPCPNCGPDTIEVVCFLEAEPLVERGEIVVCAPEGDYTVVLYCHGCAHAAALDFTNVSIEEGGLSL